MRGNTKRFFKALLRELTNWIDVTKDRSADLIISLIVYCEEHLTMDFHDTILKVVKALGMSLSEGKTSASLTTKIELILELMGRFVDPDTYVPLLLPRIVGDKESATSFSEGGAHTEEGQKVCAAAFSSLMKGTLTRQLTPHVKSIVTSLCESSDCLTSDVSTDSRIVFCRCLNTMLGKIRGNDGKVLTGYFNATGRLADLDPLWMMICRSLLALQNNTERNKLLTEEANVGLDLLSKKGGSSDGSLNTNNYGLSNWAAKIHRKALEEIMEDGHAMWEFDSSDVCVIENLWNNEEALSGMLAASADLVKYGKWIVEGVKVRRSKERGQ